MKVINISDAKQRNSRVAMEHRKRTAQTRYVDDNMQPVESVRVVKNSLETDLKTLTKECSLEDLSQQLIEGDPELDTELFGKRIYDTVRIYLNSNNEPANGVTLKELFYTPEGELKEERPLKPVEGNINTEIPLKWTGRLMPKADCYKKFVFTNAFQIKHVDGLTFDFLYSMAKELDEKKFMLFMGAGKKSNEPLVISRNGKQYRAFLEGRIKDDKYMLILHLTNLELKPLPTESSDA